MATEVIARRWGNSIGVILPKDLVLAKDIKENDIVLLEVVKRPDLRRLVAPLPRAESAQRFKDRVRAGW